MPRLRAGLRGRIGSRTTVCAVVAAFVALAFAGSANAATIVNGDFETGSLSGWQTQTLGIATESGWYAYSGTESPLSSNPIQAPPQGKFAAASDEGGPSTHILYQDVALEPFYAQQLSMLVYYQSAAAITVPSPDTLDSGGPGNQQYRVDVMKPTAPITSLEPSDILATVFQTKVGDPQMLAPTQLTVNLTPFAGQTVRLRFAEVDNGGYFNASVDAVSILSTPPSNVFSIGKATLKKKNGTAKIPVFVPGAGALTVAPASNKKPRKVKVAKLSPTTSGNFFPVVKPTSAGKKVLKEKGKLKVKLTFSFTPTGGLTSTQTKTVVLKQNKPKK
jgi:hypothetical protein